MYVPSPSPSIIHSTQLSTSLSPTRRFFRQRPPHAPKQTSSPDSTRGRDPIPILREEQRVDDVRPATPQKQWSGLTHPLEGQQGLVGARFCYARSRLIEPRQDCAGEDPCSYPRCAIRCQRCDGLHASRMYVQSHSWRLLPTDALSRRRRRRRDGHSPTGAVTNHWSTRHTHILLFSYKQPTGILSAQSRCPFAHSSLPPPSSQPSPPLSLPLSQPIPKLILPQTRHRLHRRNRQDRAQVRLRRDRQHARRRGRGRAASLAAHARGVDRHRAGEGRGAE